MYGKTILKPIETDTKVAHEKKQSKYLCFNYNSIQSAQKVGDEYYIKKIKPILDNFNHVQCGVEILSMSKRILNEVMVLAEELGVEIWYQDTDSMHMDYNKVKLLGEVFKNKYDRELIGEDLGQFHVDFEMKDAVDDIQAKESYLIATKTYFDYSESTDEKGNVINHEHTRLKAIPESCIDYTINNENID